MEDLTDFATKLFNFARSGDTTLLRYIEQGVNVDLVNQQGQSFLMLATYHGHAELTRGLIAAGATVNLPDDRGQTPLAGVVFKKEDAIIELLLDAGADPQLGSPSALEVATMFGRDDLISRWG